jgi:hypothetical protein
MYPQYEINDIIKNLNHGITIRGNLVAESIMYYGKNIENRTRKITHKYLALHLGTGRITKDVERHLLQNIENYDKKKYKLKKGHIVAILKMGESKHISELNKEEQKNKWVWKNGKYNIMNYIEKVYILKNPIKCRGFQVQTWKLECVNNNLKQKNKFDKSIKSKIITELNHITNNFYNNIEKMIGKDCRKIIFDYKKEIEIVESEFNQLQECIDNHSGQYRNKCYFTSLTIYEIKKYFDDNNIHNDIQIRLEMHKHNILNEKLYDIFFDQLDTSIDFFKKFKVTSFYNSYKPGVICLNLGNHSEIQFKNILDNFYDVIYSFDNDTSDVYEDQEGTEIINNYL